MSLARVFNYYEPEPLGECEDCVHVRHLPVEMDRKDTAHAAAAPTADELSIRIGRALLFEIFPKSLGTHVVCILIHVDKLRMRSGLGNGFRRGDKGIRDSYDDFAGLDAHRHDSESQRIG